MPQSSGVCRRVSHKKHHRSQTYKVIKVSGIQICCFSGRNKRKIMNYEKLSVIKTGSNAGLYAKCYFHMQVMYHNLFSFYVLSIKCFR